MKVEVDVLGSPSLIVLMVSVDVKLRAQGLCESRGGRNGLPVPNSPYGLCGRNATLNLNHCGSELMNCVKVAVAVLSSPSLTVTLLFEMSRVDTAFRNESDGYCFLK